MDERRSPKAGVLAALLAGAMALVASVSALGVGASTTRLVTTVQASTCEGLPCTEKNKDTDCGTGPNPPCFCNVPQSTCYSNSPPPPPK